MILLFTTQGLAELLSDSDFTDDVKRYATFASPFKESVTDSILTLVPYTPDADPAIPIIEGQQENMAGMQPYGKQDLLDVFKTENARRIAEADTRAIEKTMEKLKTDSKADAPFTDDELKVLRSATTPIFDVDDAEEQKPPQFM
jgi:hypothetical protein